ncbi:c-type cytochrome [Aggregatilinea lenta]|uniref:c-type cytochrome n=1 Tax=Aggregatilinea lenta TaxID=913108 RepID=UPI0013C33DF3|nr:c-type cytochrome [Aggregatilinea lenta]
MKQLCVLLILCVTALFTACSPGELDFSYRDLPPGDPTRGADLFTQSIDGKASCLQCHAVGTGQSAGPPFQAYAATASQCVKQQSAEEYTFYSILRPSKHIVQGYSNIMPSNYAKKLSRQEIADLIAYLLTL